MATIFRPLLVANRFIRPSSAAAIHSQPLGVNLLVLPSMLPVRQLEWPNPLRPTFPSVLRTLTNEVRLNLIGQDKFFGDAGQSPQHEFPNPSRIRDRSHVGYTFAFPLPLRGSGLPAGRLEDFPNPRSRGHAQPVAPPNLLHTTLARPIGGSAIAPNVIGRRIQIADTFPNLHQTTLARPIGRLREWPNPVRRLPIQMPDQQQGRTEEALAIPVGRQLDWPTRTRPSIQQPFQVGSRLVGSLAKPMGQSTGWANPLPIRRAGEVVPPNLLHRTLARPVGNQQTANPIPRPFPVSLRGFAVSMPLNLRSQDAFFYGPGRGPVYHWPNPTLRASSTVSLLQTMVYANTGAIRLDNRNATAGRAYGSSSAGLGSRNQSATGNT